MEKNVHRTRSSATGYNSELEKVKRRLIRAVARMLLHEKRDEKEVWAGLKKETGCDCKELWSRMHALTMKKLNRLLEAQDRVDLLPAAARMSITDWLLFDQVIVHEDFNVIGMDETTQVDRPVLVYLHKLVEEFKIEFLAGDELADAWSRLTIMYNQENRICSPMLLQKRWYQLKLATRVRFYTFWCSYKGVAKRLPMGEKYKPTPLQTQIAKAYKALVVKQFMLWDDLIKNKLVILPEEFEPKQTGQSKNEENCPDVLCLEKDVETIDVDDDSDTELEYRKPEEEVKTDAMEVKIKQEPRDSDDDVNLPFESRQEKIARVANEAMMATTLELNEIEMQFHEDLTDSELVEDVSLLDKDDEVVAENSELYNEDTIEANETLAYENTDNSTFDNSVIHVQDQNNIVAKVDTGIHPVDDLHVEENTKIPSEQDTVLPQITSVFGGVDVSNENLSKISMLTAQITNTASKTIVEKDREIPVELSSDSKEDCSDCIHIDDEVTEISVDAEDITPNVNSAWFGELSNDIDFADDGIQLMDDGIAYQDDGCEYTIDGINSNVKLETEDRDDAPKQEDDVPKVDPKLLMVPVVPTVKLDEMGILPLELLGHVDSKVILDILEFKSKQPKKEEDTSSEHSEIKIQEEIKKVKITSALLQKPRCRTYNTIQLCKNPDFNTRLKRLTVGFFSSVRNRSLFKACKPLTIDVSKAFESKLVNGTIYLKPSDDTPVSQTNDYEESSQVSVVPSAIAVQSLIDNPNVEISPTQHSGESSLLVERNKIINLPNISEIRRINQKLLTAQVTPLQIRSKSNVSGTVIASGTIHNENRDIVNTNPVGRHIAGPASRTKMLQPKAVEMPKEDTVTTPPVTNSTIHTNSQVPSTTKSVNASKLSERLIPWKPNYRADIPWTPNSNSAYGSDTLLALDTLNKMLYLLTEGDKSEFKFKIKNKKKKRLKTPDKTIVIDDNDVEEVKNKKEKKSKEALSKKAVSDTDTAIDLNDTDVEVICETKLDSSEVNKRRKTKTKKPVNCCWAREKLSQMKDPTNTTKRISKHNCSYPLCLCCCKLHLADYYNEEKLKKEASVVKPIIDIENKNDYSDVAEIIPIQQKTIEAVSTCMSNDTSKNSETEDSNTNVEVEVIDSDEATMEIHCDELVNTEVNNESASVLQISVDDEVNVGAEVSVVSSETLVPNSVVEPKTVRDQTKKLKPRFRVSHSDRSKREMSKKLDFMWPLSSQMVPQYEQCRGHSTPQDLIRVTAGQIEIKEPQDQIRVTAGQNKQYEIKEPHDQIRVTAGQNKQYDIKESQDQIRVTAGKNKQYEIKEPQDQMRVISGHLYELKKPQDQIKVIAGHNKQYEVKETDRGQLLTPNELIKVGQRRRIVIDPRPKLQTAGIGSNAINVNACAVKQISGQKTMITDSTALKLVKMDSRKLKVGSRPIAKMIYLNGKKVSQVPTDNPIFLGKNKILLTTAKFPPNYKAFEELQHNLKQTFILPRGIQLVLQPDGKLTYIRLPRSDISESFMENLPQIIEAFQHQIDSSVPLQVQTDRKEQNEVINLSDDEPSQVENIDPKFIADQGKGTDNHSVESARHSPEIGTQTSNINAIINSDISQNIKQDFAKNDNLNSNQNNGLETIHIDQLNTSQNLSLEEKENDEIDPTNKDNSGGTENDNSKAVQDNCFEKVQNDNSKQSQNNDDLATIETTSEVNSENILKATKGIEVTENKSSVATNVEESANVTSINENISTDEEMLTQSTDSDSNANNSAKTKNILSDLMAMSGIEASDVTPTAQETTPTIISQDNLTAMTPETQMLTPPVGAFTNETGQTNKELLLPALTAITSVSELKYACSQQGLFFKLDFVTGLLVPINVCMKKITETVQEKVPLQNTLFKIKAPKSVIDLTEDDVCEITDEEKAQRDVTSTLSSKQLTDVNIVEDTDKSGEGTSLWTNSRSVERMTYKRTSRNKFRGTSLLRSNQPIGERSNTDKATINKNTVPLKPLKLFKSSRPSELLKKLKEIQKRITDAMTAKDEVRRKLKRKQELLPLTEDESECSSDEEPLSQVAKKMRLTEVNPETNNAVEKPEGEVDRMENVAMETETAVDNNVEIIDDAVQPDVGMTADDECESETYLEEQALESMDDEDEDCILGV